MITSGTKLAMFVHWFVFETTIQKNNCDKRLIIQFIKSTAFTCTKRRILYTFSKKKSQEDNEILYNPSNIKDEINKVGEIYTNNKRI